MLARRNGTLWLTVGVLVAAAAWRLYINDLQLDESVVAGLFVCAIAVLGWTVGAELDQRRELRNAGNRYAALSASLQVLRAHYEALIQINQARALTPGQVYPLKKIEAALSQRFLDKRARVQFRYGRTGADIRGDRIFKYVAVALDKPAPNVGDLIRAIEEAYRDQESDLKVGILEIVSWEPYDGQRSLRSITEASVE